MFLAAPGVDITDDRPGRRHQLGDRHVGLVGRWSRPRRRLLRAVDPAASNGVIVGRLARTADAAGTADETGNGRLNLARALGDTGIDAIQPAGAPPNANGGPLVGPYVAANKNFMITFAGTGGGSIAFSAVTGTPLPSTNPCTTTCTNALDNNATGTLTVTPNGGSTFAGWTGTFVGGGTTTCSGTTSPCTFSLSNSAQALTATFNGPADLDLTKSDSPDPVASGSTLTYTIVVTNNGGAPAAGVSIADTLPAALTGVDISSLDGVFACETTDTFPCALGTVAAGASVTITVTGTVSGCLNLSNTATASTTSTQSDLLDLSDTETTAVLCPDLDLTKSDSPDPVASGSTLTYTIVVTNNGGAPAAGVSVVDTLPAALTGVSINVPSLVLGCETTDTFPCALGTVAAGASVTITVTGTVTGCLNLSNTATASTTSTQSDLLDLSDTETTAVLCPDLDLTKSDSPDPVASGSTLTYTIVVTNNGGAPAAGVSVVDTLPAALTGVSINVPSLVLGCETTDTFPCALGTVAAGASVTITVTGTVSGCLNLSNTATASTTSTQSDLLDLSDTETTAVLCPDLDLTKSDSPDPVASGSTLTYTIVVTNNGGAPAAGVSVVDTLPAALTGVSINVPSLVLGCETTDTFPCALGTVAAGASVTITVTGTVTGCLNLSNTATASTTSTQSDLLDLSDTETTAVQCTASLTIVKTVVNDNGGTKTVADFGVTTSAGALTFGAGVGTTTKVYTATALTVNAGTYSLSESDLAGYAEGSWSCTNGGGGAFNAGTVTLANGASVTCTITNDDDAPSPDPRQDGDQRQRRHQDRRRLRGDDVRRGAHLRGRGRHHDQGLHRHRADGQRGDVQPQRERPGRLRRRQLVVHQRRWRRLQRRHRHPGQRGLGHLHDHQRRRRAVADPGQGRHQRQRRRPSRRPTGRSPRAARPASPGHDPGAQRGELRRRHLRPSRDRPSPATRRAPGSCVGGSQPTPTRSSSASATTSPARSPTTTTRRS